MHHGTFPGGTAEQVAWVNLACLPNAATHASFAFIFSAFKPFLSKFSLKLFGGEFLSNWFVSFEQKCVN